MRNPRRRFVRGFTLVNDWLEFWYIDQGNIIASETVHWIDSVGVIFLYSESETDIAFVLSTRANVR